MKKGYGLGDSGEYLHIRVPKGFLEQCHEVANEKGMGLSSFVRSLLVREIRKSEKEAA
jgi:hypothetical protein